jgi:hypothetical protein
VVLLPILTEALLPPIEAAPPPAVPSAAAAMPFSVPSVP